MEKTKTLCQCGNNDAGAFVYDKSNNYATCIQCGLVNMDFLSFDYQEPVDADDMGVDEDVQAAIEGLTKLSGKMSYQRKVHVTGMFI
jgi:hypothetical protein